MGNSKAQINHLGRLLNEIKLLEEQNLNPKVFSGGLSITRQLNYENIWISIYKNFSYYFLLKDNSLINYNLNESNPTFSYYACPYRCYTYKDFVRIIMHENPKNVGDKYEVEYSQYLNDSEKNINPITIRYDYDATSYIEGVHPTSHIHIGMDNEIRIGIRKIFNPLSFTFFILRQIYPESWKELIKKANKKKILSRYKNDLIGVNKIYCLEKDEWEFYLV